MIKKVNTPQLNFKLVKTKLVQEKKLKDLRQQSVLQVHSHLRKIIFPQAKEEYLNQRNLLDLIRLVLT